MPDVPTAPFLVSVDVGRSSVKVAYLHENKAVQFSFPFLTAAHQSAIAANASILSDRNLYYWVDLDGEEILFGETAERLGDQTLDMTEGETFIENNIKATIFAVAECLYRVGVSSRDVVLAINLTFQNHHLKETFQKALTGSHKVFYRLKQTTVEFSISRVNVLYQGYSGAFSVIMGTDLQVRPEFKNADGVVMDFGRYTIDLTHINNMSPVEGKSFPFGTNILFEQVAQDLRSKYDIIKEVGEIERAFIAGKLIRTLKGLEVDLTPIVEEHAAKSFAHVHQIFSTFIGTKTPDWVVLLGGGALLYAPYLKDKYPIVELAGNTQFANAVGMLRFLLRITPRA
jgi:hypothetical protein